MKLLILIVAALIISNVTAAQPESIQEALAYEIIKTCDATISDEGHAEDGNYIISLTPSYYSEDLVKMEIKRVERRLSDVKQIGVWRKTEGGSISLTLKIDGEGLFFMSYMEEDQILVFVWE